MTGAGNATVTGVGAGDVVEVEVGPAAHGGFCVARLDGQAVFVRHALPGERVRARVTERRSRYLRADAVAVLRASEDRVPAPCPYAAPGRCGGCDWQHASLPAQRRLKAAVVREQLARLAGLDREVEVEALPGHDDGLGWRTRVRFAVRPDGVAGLHRHRSDEIEPLDFCRIAHPDVEDVGVESVRWPGVSAIEVATSATYDDTVAVVTPGGDRPAEVELPDGVGVLRRDARSGSVRPVAVPHGVRERVAGRTFEVHGGGFWQVHPAAAETLAAAVLDLLAPRPGETAVDLYCGAGLFTALLAEAVGAAGRVTGVEGNRQTVADAARNTADLPQARVRTWRVDARAVSRLGRPGGVDLVVCDPSRAGLGTDVVRAVAGLGPRAVAYVACDPAALARDVAVFAGAGYALRGLRAFDLFPMTAHVECVALLEPTP